MEKPFYDHKTIETKWKKRWDGEKLYQVDSNSDKEKFYCLDMFPYPSGLGLHVGHWRGYVLSDYYARYQMLKGKNVLHPMGFDSFGLPAERAAIKNNLSPDKFTNEAIVSITTQLKELGSAFDWSKYLYTSDKNYYKWTQWLFVQLFEHGLAEKRLSQVNWCPTDQTVLANEQVVNGCCERCGAAVTKKELSQWYLKTTDFSQELLDGLKDVNWPERTKSLQRDWIGKSVGTSVKFPINNGQIEVFTTRVDTIFGVTALILAPEHSLVDKITISTQKKSVEEYITNAKSKTNIDREQNKEKTAVFTGSFASHPLTGEQIPVWVADYVLLSYGTGAVMAVPAHDERDFDFATKYDLPIIQVIIPSNGTSETKLFTDYGMLINSGEYNKLTSKEAQEKITVELSKKGLGSKTTTYRLRDWLVSRQRYWGAPIPIVYDPQGNPHTVKEEHLPLTLPTDVDFLPGGESPLARSRQYSELAEKLYGKGWHFDTDTLDTFVDSSWYYLRYLSPNDSLKAFDKDLVEKWLPVDLYIGGIEHATLHLLYARFITKFLAKFGYINSKITEPFQQLFNIGLVNLHGAKMSKSKGNVVSPDLIIEHYGTDALRGYELFIGPLDIEAEWSNNGINGIHRFLLKVFQIYMTSQPNDDAVQGADTAFNKYLIAINDMIAGFRLNTAISEAMKLVNEPSFKNASQKMRENFLVTLSPIFPFMCEELWEQMGHKESIFKATWPQATKLTTSPVLSILVNQKFVATLSTGETEEAIIVEIAKALPAVKDKISGRETKAIFKAGKMVNFVAT